MKDKRKGKKDKMKEEEICEKAFHKTVEYMCRKSYEESSRYNALMRKIKLRSEIRRVRTQGTSYVITIPPDMLIHLGFDHEIIKKRLRNIGYVRLIQKEDNKIILERV